MAKKKKVPKGKTNSRRTHHSSSTLSNLDKNMFALQRVNRTLFQRVCYPVGDDHTRFDENGELLYKVHRQWYPLETDEAHLEELTPETGSPLLVFGVGHGTILHEIMKRFPGLPLIVWERDPWLLRLTLQRFDLSRQILRKQVRFSLGPDLLEFLEEVNWERCVLHPFLRAIYRRELEYFQNAPHSRTVLLREGTLFVDDFATALKEQGIGVYSLDTDRLSREELFFTVDKLNAEALASINYANNSAEFCQQAGIKLLCWEVDPSVGQIIAPETSTKNSFIFSYRKSNVEEFQSAGFEQVEYLPLGTNTKFRTPVRLSEAEEREYGAPVSFVGASMVQDSDHLLQEFFSCYQEWCNNDARLMVEGQNKIEYILEVQRQDFTVYRIGELLTEYFQDFLTAAANHYPNLNLELMVAEKAASEKRLYYLAALASFGVKVWGDDGWTCLTEYGVQFAGRYARHRNELNKVYSASRINLDIGRIYQSDIVTMRVFDVLACGGFLISEYNEALAELFELDREVVAYRSLQELKEKVAYYLEYPEKARKIAELGREAVLKRHHLAGRFSYMFSRSGLSQKNVAESRSISTSLMIEEPAI